MSETPPPYAQYPRGNVPVFDTAAIRNLADGYFGLSRVFALNVVLIFAFRIVTLLAARSLGIAGIAAYLIVAAVVTGYLSYAPCKKIGYGANWSPAQPVIASVLIGLNFWLCCGAIGFSVMQTIASNHLKRYGIKLGLFSNKKKVDEQITAMEGSNRPF